MVTGHCPGRVPPFGYPWINAYLRLPMAFRSLSRPSSAISALASTLRSCSLDLASSIVSIFLRLLRNENDSKVCCFVSSLCSFQGALKARMNLDSALRLPLDLSDPSKRYRNHHRTTAKLFSNSLRYSIRPVSLRPAGRSGFSFDFDLLFSAFAFPFQSRRSTLGYDPLSTDHFSLERR